MEINLRKTKWPVFGGYNNVKSNINAFLRKLGQVLDANMSRLENFLLLGDFNSEITEIDMKDFCDIYNLENIGIGPTCFKNPFNPSAIDLMLTNRKKKFPKVLTSNLGFRTTT